MRNGKVAGIGAYLVELGEHSGSGGHGSDVGEQGREKKIAAEVVFHNPHHLIIVDLIRWLLLSLHSRCMTHLTLESA